MSGKEQLPLDFGKEPSPVAGSRTPERRPPEAAGRPASKPQGKIRDQGGLKPGSPGKEPARPKARPRPAARASEVPEDARSESGLWDRSPAHGAGLRKEHTRRTDRDGANPGDTASEDVPENQGRGQGVARTKARPRPAAQADANPGDTAPEDDLWADPSGTPEAAATGLEDQAAPGSEDRAGPGGTDSPGPGGSDSSPPGGQDPLRSLMDDYFLQYASYVIRDRAIPNLEDGLKPVQRRILHSLHDMDDGRFIKVANVVGHTMQYHPHGDASITEALTTLVNKGYLIEGQGNFGNLFTGDQAAAARYIECRLTELARKEIFNPELTRFVPSYDGRKQEPVSLPAKLPLLLMLGAEGIAVGLSTRILPHNFRELLAAEVAILTGKSFTILPDFQQGGLMDVSEYNRGNGRVRLRARIGRKGPDKLVVTELPFGCTTESLISSIEDAIRKKKVPARSIDDFTAEKVNIEITLLPEAVPAKAVQALYAFTACESTVSGHATVIHRGRPTEMEVDQILRENAQQLVKLLKQELTLERRRLLEEIHAKSLVQIFVENRIYKRIEECTSYPDMFQAVSEGLEPFAGQMEREVTRKDLEMLLGIRIRRISRFDSDKNRKEIEQLRADRQKVEKNLEDPKAYALQYLRNLLRACAGRYERRTEVAAFESLERRELAAREVEILHDQARGYLGEAVKEGASLFKCSSNDKIVLVWDDGLYKVIPPPETLFVGENLVYCGRMERDRVMTMVYVEEGLPYVKRFAFGGAIQNKEYRCTREKTRVLLFADDDPPSLYVKYQPAKRQRIHQQVFHPGELPVRNVKARGVLMAPKEIEKVSRRKPSWWNDGERSARGVLVDS